MLKRLTACLLGAVLFLLPLQVAADEIGVDLRLDEELPEAVSVISIVDSLPATSAILIDQGSGKVLYEQNPDEQLPPASITKVMTLLLVMEALEKGKIKLDDMVVSSEHAASMGGSQIWLKVGEQMTVDQLLKAVAISSANDASVALAEHVAGSHEAFVDMMNQRAQELAMENTHFLNCTGLDEQGHLSTARDVALMSKELMKHPRISEYSTVWMDSLRGGETELVNTNRLVRFYNGCTGLKTGTTSGAGSCLSATATRDNLSLVAVVMGSPTSDQRFAAARGLLDYGFANYMSLTPPSVADQLKPVRVLRGTKDFVTPIFDPPGAIVVDKQSEDAVTQQVTLAEDIQAPVEAGQVIGMVEVLVDGQLVGSYPLKAGETVDKMTLGKAFIALIKALMTMTSSKPSQPQVPLQPSSSQEEQPGQSQASSQAPENSAASNPESAPAQESQPQQPSAQESQPQQSQQESAQAPEQEQTVEVEE